MSPPEPPLRQLHLDFHTPGGIAGVARLFDAGAFARTMAAARVASVNVFARCHHGFSYYPTSVGTMHPGLGFDLLGAQIEALHREGIRAIVYLTIGWDDLAAERNPGWVVVNRSGALNARRPFEAPSIAGGLSPNDAGPNAPRWSLLDPTTGYRDYVADQIRELCARYPLDGFWFDICLPVPNYSPWGRSQMAAAGVDAADEAAVFAFARARELAWLDRFSALARELAPDADVFFNGTTDASMAETVPFQTHLDLESLATSPGLWGYLHYPIVARHARTYGLPFLGMTGRFHKSWADFGGIKTDDQLDYEAAAIMAAGGGVFVGDQLHPSGVLDPAVYRLVGRVFERVERLEPWLRRARSAAEVALVSAPRLESFGGQPAIVESPEVEGLAQAFLESAVQFDVVDAGADLSRYRLVVVPDGLGPSAKVLARLREHLAAGGSVLLTGTALLGSDGRFALDEVPVEYAGPAPTLPTYFRPDEWLTERSESYRARRGLATDYDYVLYDRAVLVRPRPGAAAHGSLAAAMFERTPQHFFSHAQAPVGEPLDAPLAVFGERVGYLAAPLGRGYRDHDYWAYRAVLDAVVGELLPEPLLRFDGPPWVEASVLRQDAADGRPARSIIHLVAYQPRRTMQSVPHVDRAWPVGPVSVALRVGEATVARCYLAPDETPLEPRREGAHVRVDLPGIGTHTVVVFEEARG